ncbi:MAG: ATP-NAD kinase [Chloroflexi bacterium]|nr:ATP-NAD kinase [Chloroflexi bacterium CFX1]MCQ3953810.1 ATP-NAD kinase [Chloroflexota bacterium]RIK54130.1 MAG: ATP-NAD kinase [Chloroflexota bacterium]
MTRIGLIVNPLAGIGGRVGLKGSDGIETQRRALELGATPEAHQRAALSLLPLYQFDPALEVLTAPREMGETSARAAGFAPKVIGEIHTGATTAEDTRRAAHEISALGVDLILFAGGDGTARDICSSLPANFPCLGIPAGVKIHSAVYATNPKHAGELAVMFLQGKAHLCEAEVLDLDEAAYRDGRVSARLYGTLHVPHRPLFLQNQKAPSPESEAYQAEAIAADVVEQMQKEVAYILGPGTTTRAIANALYLEKTLVGVDVVCNNKLIAKDATQTQLLNLLETMPAKIIVTPIGGQGFLFGRGNQQIGPEVIRKVGRGNIIVVGTADKLRALRMQPLLADTGDAEVDSLLEGYFAVVTGYRESMMYKVGS